MSAPDPIPYATQDICNEKIFMLKLSEFQHRKHKRPDLGLAFGISSCRSSSSSKDKKGYFFNKKSINTKDLLTFVFIVHLTF